MSIVYHQKQGKEFLPMQSGPAFKFISAVVAINKTHPLFIYYFKALVLNSDHGEGIKGFDFNIVHI